MLIWLVAVAGAQEPPVLTVREDVPEPNTVAFRLSLVPGIGIHAAPNAVVDGFSAGVVSVTQGLEGFDGQLGVSSVNGPVQGAQLALGVAVALEDVQGIQSALGASVIGGSLEGMQATVGANVIGDALQGVQAAVGANVIIGEGSHGAQLSSGLNVARDLKGVQAGTINIAQKIQGAQAGLVNVADESQGVQVGLVNVARTSNVSIGLLNFIGDGLHRVDVWTDTSSVANVALKLGSKQVYTLLGVGVVNTSQDWLTTGGGLGVHLDVKPVWFEVDGSAWGLFSPTRGVAPGVLGRVRAQVGVDLFKRHVAPFAGVSLNTWAGTGAVWTRPVGVPFESRRDNKFVAWPGAHVGVSF